VKHHLNTYLIFLVSTFLWLFYPFLSVARQVESDSLMQVIKTTADDSLKVDAIIDFTNLILDTEPDSAFFLLERADNILKENPVLHLKIRVNNAKSIILQNIGKLPEALELQFETKKLMEGEDGSKKRAISPNDYLNTINTIGLIFYKTEKYSDAVAYFEQALEILNKTDHNLISDINNEYLRFNLNIGAVHAKIRDFEKAGFYFTKALQYLDEGNSKNYAVLLNNLSIVARENGDIEKAFELNQKAIKVSNESENYRILVQAYNNMGNNFMVAGDFYQAKTHFMKAYTLAEKYGYGSSMVVALDMLASAYDSTGDYRNAYKTHVQFKHFSDSLLDLEKVRMVTQLEMKDNFDKRLATARILQNEKEAGQRKRELIYTLIIVFTLMGLIILVLLFFLQQSKSKRHRLEAEKSSLLSKSLGLEKTKLEEELEFRNKELATNVMYMIRKNELIAQISERLVKSKLAFKKENQRIIEEIISDLQSSTEDNIWRDFEVRFQQVHNDFYEKINEKFPNLTSNEKKLCAFLRLNMSTKEISAITYQSLNSIVVARSRLRKKLGLDSEENLIAYLEGI
jgi:tetratricopeptide (TPR) repeat protein